MASSSPRYREPRLAQECPSTMLAASQVPAMGEPCSDLFEGQKRTWRAVARWWRAPHIADAGKPTTLINAAQTAWEARRQLIPTVSAINAVPPHSVRHIKVSFGTSRTNRNNREPGTCCSWGLQRACAGPPQTLAPVSRQKLSPCQTAAGLLDVRSKNEANSHGVRSTLLQPSRTGQACQAKCLGLSNHACMHLHPLSTTPHQQGADPRHRRAARSLNG